MIKMTNEAIINAALGQDFADRIETATRENVTTVGEKILNYAPAKNQFLDVLFNKIGLTLINKLTFSNPFARFRGANIPYGDTIEDIYVGLITGYEYSQDYEAGTEKDPFSKKEPNVTAIYHTINVELQYKVTINDSLLRRAFRNAGGLSALINDIVASTVESADYDEYLNTVAMLSSDSILGAKVNMGERTADETANSKTLLTAIKETATQMTFLGSAFNQAKQKATTPKENQLLIITGKARDLIDIDYLAGVYNLSKVDMMGKIIEIPEFINEDGSANTDRVALLVDDRGFKMHKALVDGGLIYNPQGKYTNHFYNNWEIISWSLYRNAVAFDFATEA